MKRITAACLGDQHDLCKCKLRGQDPRYAAAIIEFNPVTGCFEIVGRCECECHDDAPVDVAHRSATLVGAAS